MIIIYLLLAAFAVWSIVAAVRSVMRELPPAPPKEGPAEWRGNGDYSSPWHVGDCVLVDGYGDRAFVVTKVTAGPNGEPRYWADSPAVEGAIYINGLYAHEIRER